MSGDCWLVVGLGNPGPPYAGNRHNVGAMVVDVVGARTGEGFRRHKAGAAVLQSQLGPAAGSAPGPRVALAKPSCYMNESGGPVARLVRFFDVQLGHLVVVHDDLDIPYSHVRLKQGGGEGGHNGLRSISRSIGSREYVRVRVGIGRPPGRRDPANYVLDDFSRAERADLALVLEQASDAVHAVLTQGLAAAQQRFHQTTS